MNAPIGSIAEDGFIKVAQALKKTGSMMWTGSPIPSNLEEIVKTGVPVCQTVKPLRDRKALKEHLIEIEKTGVTWLGIETDAGQCTKVLDTMMTKDCFPVSVAELKELKAAVGIARPVLWALAADGEEGVVSLITEFSDELKRYMTMTGIEQPKEAHPSILLKSPYPLS